MKVIGIDLSGPRNAADTVMTIFDERGNELNFVDALHGADDPQILHVVSNLPKAERIAIGIDAPLSYNATGGDRPSDSELRHLVRERGGGTNIMPPTMIRMVYLTLRGVTLARLLESLNLNLGIVEVHPGACMLLRGAPTKDVAGFKRRMQARLSLLNWMESQGLKGLPRAEDVADHFVASCAAALGAWQWSIGKSVWVHLAVPPWHPYDFAC